MSTCTLANVTSESLRSASFHTFSASSHSGLPAERDIFMPTVIEFVEQKGGQAMLDSTEEKIFECMRKVEDGSTII
jgi:hypothetical protein